MKTLILTLIIISFIQTTIVPLDLVLIILICRGYIKSDKANLWLAFGFGLLIDFLSLTNLGVHSLIYLVLISLTQALSKSRLAGNSSLIVPLSLILLSINQIILSIFAHTSLDLFPKNLLEALISLPSLALIKLWEERYIIKREIRLKI